MHNINTFTPWNFNKLRALDVEIGVSLKADAFRSTVKELAGDILKRRRDVFKLLMFALCVKVASFLNTQCNIMDPVKVLGGTSAYKYGTADCFYILYKWRGDSRGAIINTKKDI